MKPTVDHELTGRRGRSVTTGPMDATHSAENPRNQTARSFTGGTQPRGCLPLHPVLSYGLRLCDSPLIEKKVTHVEVPGRQRSAATERPTRQFAPSPEPQFRRRAKPLWRFLQRTS
jgi:hypothetical protein